MSLVCENDRITQKELDEEQKLEDEAERKEEEELKRRKEVYCSIYLLKIPYYKWPCYY